MRSGRITNLDKEDVMPKENYAWYYLGNGIETFGINGKPSKYEMKLPGKDEILARVDAVALCASDIKMIRMGNDYPLFKNRDFHKDPAILGHELSLTIEEVGENLKDRWKKGMRVRGSAGRLHELCSLLHGSKCRWRNAALHLTAKTCFLF